MTLTTRVRFLGPVNPRLIWQQVPSIVGAPPDYSWYQLPARDETINAPNPSIWAESGPGANAWARLYYGAEGSLLIEDDDERPAPPPAYAELRLDSAVESGHLRGPMVAKLVAWSPVPVVWTDDYEPDWLPL